MTNDQQEIQKLGKLIWYQIEKEHLAKCQRIAGVAIVHALSEQPDDAYTTEVKWDRRDARVRATSRAIFYDEQRRQTVRIPHPNGLYCRVIGYALDGVLTAYDDPAGYMGLDGTWDETLVLPLSEITSCEALLKMVEHLTDDFPYKMQPTTYLDF